MVLLSSMSTKTDWLWEWQDSKRKPNEHFRLLSLHPNIVLAHGYFRPENIAVEGAGDGRCVLDSLLTEREVASILNIVKLLDVQTGFHLAK